MEPSGASQPWLRSSSISDSTSSSSGLSGMAVSGISLIRSSTERLLHPVSFMQESDDSRVSSHFSLSTPSSRDTSPGPSAAPEALTGVGNSGPSPPWHALPDPSQALPCWQTTSFTGDIPALGGIYCAMSPSYILGIQNLQGGLAENVSRIIVLNLNYGCFTATETVFAVRCMMHQP